MLCACCIRAIRSHIGLLPCTSSHSPYIIPSLPIQPQRPVQTPESRRQPRSGLWQTKPLPHKVWHFLLDMTDADERLPIRETRDADIAILLGLTVHHNLPAASGSENLLLAVRDEKHALVPDRLVHAAEGLIEHHNVWAFDDCPKE